MKIPNEGWILEIETIVRQACPNSSTKGKSGVFRHYSSQCYIDSVESGGMVSWWWLSTLYFSRRQRITFFAMSTTWIMQLSRHATVVAPWDEAEQAQVEQQ
jgi:hypothetical protein